MVGLFAIQLPPMEDVSRLPQIEDVEKINNLDTKSHSEEWQRESKTCCFYDLTITDLNIEFNV